MAQELAGGTSTREGSMAILSTLLASANVLQGAKLRLYKNTFAPVPGSDASAFAAAECDFSGYAAVPLTWSALGLDANGVPAALSNRAFFQATDNAVPNNVGGCWIQEDSVGPPAEQTSIRYYPFGTPKNLTDALDFVGIVICVQDPVTPGYAIVDY